MAEVVGRVFIQTCHVSPVCLSLYLGPVVVLCLSAGALGLDCRTLPRFLHVSISFSLRRRKRDKQDDWRERQTHDHDTSQNKAAQRW